MPHSTKNTGTNENQGVQQQGHPAPLPRAPTLQTANENLKPVPPKPTLKVLGTSEGIIISWNIGVDPSEYAEIASFQPYSYKEMPGPISRNLWQRIGFIDAMNLPMASSLEGFAEGYRYHFTIRAKDVHNRYSAFSDPVSIDYTNQVN